MVSDRASLPSKSSSLLRTLPNSFASEFGIFKPQDLIRKRFWPNLVNKQSGIAASFWNG